MRRHSVITMASNNTMEPQEEYRQAFLRMGFGYYSEGVDPEEIIRTCLSHEEIKKELDAKHDEDMERIAILRDQLVRFLFALLEGMIGSYTLTFLVLGKITKPCYREDSVVQARHFAAPRGQRDRDLQCGACVGHSCRPVHVRRSECPASKGLHCPSLLNPPSGPDSELLVFRLGCSRFCRMSRTRQ
jgi:hypothetical protein